MKDDNAKKSKLSWSRSLVKKLFNIKSKSQDFSSDHAVCEGDGGVWSTNFSEREAWPVKKSRTERLPRKISDRSGRTRNDFDSSSVTHVQDYRIFAATWNVGGKSPPRTLNLDDWLHSSPPADIYVLGFQEIVPLSPGNVLGTEDNGPAKKWLALIRKTLNKIPGGVGSGSYHSASPSPYPVVEIDADFEGSTTKQNLSFFHRRSFQNFSRSLRLEGDFMGPQPKLDRRFSVCDPVSFGSRPSDFNARCVGSSDDENVDEEPCSASFPSPVMYHCGSSQQMEECDRSSRKRSSFSSPFLHSYGTPTNVQENNIPSTSSRYCLVASKQMVGIFLTVWVRSEIREDVKNVKVSCIGRGLMGYLGNKGSISMSMSLHQTSFCFICCHLTSGEKEGDELRRNSDVMEIMRKTRFPPLHPDGDLNSPETILEHDRIIWLGDLNYRIALSYCSARALVEMHNWKMLLEKDQLRIERRRGRIFQGWKEGRIYFPPTYKYSNNSDRYAGEGMHPKEKRRTPAWCDRILWYGKGLNQLSYVRGESRFSDHRPVYSIFKAEVEIISRMRTKRNMGLYGSRIEIEELLPYSHGNADFHLY